MRLAGNTTNKLQEEEVPWISPSTHFRIVFTWGFREECLKHNKGVWQMKLKDKWTEIHWDYLLGYIALREADSTIYLGDRTWELAGDKTWKLNSPYFSLSESFLFGRGDKFAFFISSVWCGIVYIEMSCQSIFCIQVISIWPNHCRQETQAV